MEGEENDEVDGEQIRDPERWKGKRMMRLMGSE